MKFLSTAALIVAVTAVCEEGEDGVCDPAENKCLKRVSTAVGSTKGKKYKAAIKADETAKKDGVKYMCSAPADAEALVATSGVEDKDTTITFTYEDKTPVPAGEGEGTKSNATPTIIMKSTFVAAALGLMSYM